MSTTTHSSLAGFGEPRWLVLAILSTAEFVGGVAVMIFDVNTTALTQTVTSDHLCGRTAGAMSFLTQSAEPLGSLFGGAAGTAIGLHATLWACAAGGLLVLPWTIPRRSGAELRRARRAAAKSRAQSRSWPRPEPPAAC